MKQKMNISIFKRAALMLLVMMLTTLGAWAGNTDLTSDGVQRHHQTCIKL